MSGNCGNVGPPVGPPEPPMPCDRLIFETVVQSPDPVVVKQIKPNEICDVKLEVLNNHPVITVRRRVQNMARLGSITVRITDLVRCIKSGRDFQAVILSINKGVVRIRVEPRP